MYHHLPQYDQLLLVKVGGLACCKHMSVDYKNMFKLCWTTNLSSWEPLGMGSSTNIKTTNSPMAHFISSFDLRKQPLSETLRSTDWFKLRFGNLSKLYIQASNQPKPLVFPQNGSLHHKFLEAKKGIRTECFSIYFWEKCIYWCNYWCIYTMTSYPYKLNIHINILIISISKQIYDYESTTENKKSIYRYQCHL